MNTAHSKIVIPGGSGFLGGVLSRWFSDCGWDVVILARHANASAPAGRVVVLGR